MTLTCPRCALPHESDERFCRSCGMPLVYSGAEEEAPLTSREEWARKIRPQYARGEVRRVAGGRNQSEAEMIQGMLLEEGIPSILRRTRGFDVPDFLAAGPRDVMVPESGYEAARSLLSDVGLEAREGPSSATSPGKLALGLLAVAAVGTLVAWLLYEIAG